MEEDVLAHPELVDRPYRMVVEYQRPIEPGATITVRRLREDDRLTLWLLLGEEKTVAATISLGPLPIAA